jgi:hypothetical protein
MIQPSVQRIELLLYVREVLWPHLGPARPGLSFLPHLLTCIIQNPRPLKFFLTRVKLEIYNFYLKRDFAPLREGTPHSVRTPFVFLRI